MRDYINTLKKNWVVITLFFVVFLAVLSVFFVRFYVIEGTLSVAFGSPKDSLIVVKTEEILKRYVFKSQGYAQKNEKIGWVTDIHADRFKRRSVDSGTIYPRQYSDYLPKVFNAMRERGIDTVIATGDNANSGDDNYGRALAKIAQEKHMNVLWVTGNHDSDKSMAAIGIPGSKYFFTEYGDTRIIVLDDAIVTRKTGNYEGGTDAEQLDWLRTALNTKKQVIIAMHIPIFREHFDWLGEVLKRDKPSPDALPLPENTVVVERQSELESILHESNNVKMVFTGHWHIPWYKEYNGIDYYGEAALTHELYKGAYGVIDLKNNSVEYLSVK